MEYCKQCFFRYTIKQETRILVSHSIQSCSFDVGHTCVMDASNANLNRPSKYGIKFNWISFV